MYNPYAEEIRRQREQLAAMGIQPESSGMTPGMGQAGAIDPTLLARAGVDTSTQKAKLARQGKYADMLRGREMPKGREVGPLGVYMGPNWGETLAGAMNPVIAGVMDRSMEDDYANLSAAEADKNMAGLELEDARRMAGQAFKTGEREAGQAYTTAENVLDRGLRQTIADMGDLTSRRGQDINAASSAASTAATLSGQTTSQEGQNLRSRDKGRYKLEDGTFLNTIIEGGVDHAINENGTKGDPILVPNTAQPIDLQATAPGVGMSQGNRIELEGVKQEDRIELERLRNKLNTEGELATEERERLRDIQSAVWEADVGAEQRQAQISDTASTFTNVLTNPSTDKFTGLLSIPRVLSVAGIGDEAWKGQAIDQQLKYGGTALIADLASIFKPMSDTDLKYLLSQFAGSTNEPETITAWLGNNGRQTLKKNYMEARAELRTPEQKAKMDAAWGQVESQIDAAVGQAAFRQGIPVTDAKAIGMDPEELEYIYAQLAKQAGNGTN